MKKRFVIPISIIAILTLVSIASAGSPWADFTADLLGVEEITDFYQNKHGIWVAEAYATGDVLFHFENGDEIEGTFEFWSTALFVNGLDDPDSAVIHAKVLFRDANSDGEFECKARGIGSFGKIKSIKATGAWKKQKIQSKYETLGDPDGEGPLNFSAILNGKWKNPDDDE